MRFTSHNLILSASLLAAFTSQVVSVYAEPKQLKPRRTSSILINPAPQPQLPTAQQAQSAAAAASLNLTNIQGDILVGMKKNKELFFFFGISDVATFKSKLASDIYPLITSTTEILSVDTQPVTLVNIAFSQSGLNALGVTDNLGDSLFTAGQTANANNLGDPGTTNWIPGFVGTGVHGIMLLASDTVDNINATLANITTALGSSITEIHSLQGSARPGAEQGHEHFGFADGISQPAVDGFTASPKPGQSVLAPGNFLLGETGDPVLSSRPSWATDGSFLAFRQLQQLVPEFNKFLTDNPIQDPGLTPEEGSALLGARMIGRWKSGAPIDLAPLQDDPVLGADPNRNNNFTFANESTNQTRCPFSAHIRKTRPRDDLPAAVDDAHQIIRSALPYGPEVTDAEAASNTTSIERGLAFVAYQSDIGTGFQFLQQTWASNPGFKTSGVGFDPIIGANHGNPRNVSGLDPLNPSGQITLLTDFVVSRGGEYFFSPSLSAIIGTLAV